jgi:hypothetical protein
VLLAVVMGLLVVASLVAFLVPLRIATRAQEARPASAPHPGTGTEFVGLDHLDVGVELMFDRQRWFVRGVQEVAPADGAAWTAWHLDDRGQGGLLVTGAREDEVFFAVRAERPETLDPTLAELRWRDHDWVRVREDGGPVAARGERRLARRGALVPVSPDDVERVVYVREELPARRLVLERSAGEGWNAWIGTAVPGRMVDVWPPPLGTGPAATADGGPAEDAPGDATRDRPTGDPPVTDGDPAPGAGPPPAGPQPS